jgi:hypothetical protein
LGRPSASFKGKFVVEGLDSLFSISRRPIGDKCASTVKARVLVTNNGDILEGAKGTKRRKNVLFT